MFFSIFNKLLLVIYTTHLFQPTYLLIFRVALVPSFKSFSFEKKTIQQAFLAAIGNYMIYNFSYFNNYYRNFVLSLQNNAKMIQSLRGLADLAEFLLKYPIELSCCVIF